MFGFVEKWLTKKVIVKYADKMFRHALTALGVFLITSEISVCEALPICDQLGTLISTNVDMITQELVGYVLTAWGLWRSAKEAPAAVVGKEVLKMEEKRQ